LSETAWERCWPNEWIEEDANREALKGTIIAWMAQPNSTWWCLTKNLRLVAFEGSQVVVAIQPTAMFQIGRKRWAKAADSAFLA